MVEEVVVVGVVVVMVVVAVVVVFMAKTGSHNAGSRSSLTRMDATSKRHMSVAFTMATDGTRPLEQASVNQTTKGNSGCMIASSSMMMASRLMKSRKVPCAHICTAQRTAASGRLSRTFFCSMLFHSEALNLKPPWRLKGCPCSVQSIKRPGTSPGPFLADIASRATSRPTICSLRTGVEAGARILFFVGVSSSSSPPSAPKSLTAMC
jgi:hypothetical protein